MAVLQMQKISICALKKNRKSILETLQGFGVMEITTDMEEGSGFHKMDTVSSWQLFEKNAVMADQALDLLQSYIPEKKSLLSSLEGKALTDAKAFVKVQDESGDVLNEAKRILALHKQIAEDKAGVQKLETQIESLTPWMNLDVPVNFRGTRRCAALIGTLTEVMTLEQIHEVLAAKAPELEKMDIQVIGADRDQTCIAAVCLKEEAARLEEILRTIGFSKPSQQISEVPSVFAEGLRAQIAELNRSMEGARKELEGFSRSREKLQLVSDYFRIRAQKYAVLGVLPQSEKTFIIMGYVPSRAVKTLENKLCSAYDLVFEQEEISEEEEAPVLLSNNTFASSGEGVLESFGLPAKGEMDPSLIMTACYVFLFGLMLSDAAYGLIVFAACFYALKKFPRMDGNMKKSVRLFMYCGLSTIFWGVMFGGYFGDAVDIVSKTFFGSQVTIPALWFIPLNDPMKMLVFSLLFGTIHLFLGLAMKGYALLKDKKYLDFVCDVVLWYMLLSGLILILLPTELFSSIAQMQFAFPPAVAMLAKWLAIIGAVGILFMSGRSSKNPVLRVALGAYDLYNMTGWLSDVLSYSRLLALGLATGVIGSVINQMGSMAGGGILGAVLFIVAFTFGHIFNLGINLLGAYVHTCRLQYVEFFGKFYDGGGRLFAPFRQDTKYVDIKED